MIKTKEYRAFGLNILSVIPLPEIVEENRSNKNPDVIIRIDDLSKLWSSLAKHPYSFVIKKDFVMFQLPDVAIYLIENGKSITVSPLENANLDQIRLFILGTCMGAILMQRKVLPLHGSSIEIDGRAYAIVGDSGAGKSTLASNFLDKGYDLLSDDVIPVSLSYENLAMVNPAYPQQKLWQESLDAFGMKSHDYRPVFGRETKFTVPVASQFSSKPLPLSGVFELVKTDEDEIKVMPIHGLKRLHALFHHTYRNLLIDRLGLREWHFSMTAKIANQIPVYQLQRPKNRFTAHDLALVILNTINKEVIEI